MDHDRRIAEAVSMPITVDRGVPLTSLDPMTNHLLKDFEERAIAAMLADRGYEVQAEGRG